MGFKVDAQLKNEYMRYIAKEYSEHNANLAGFVLETVDNYEHTINAHIYNFNEENMLAVLGMFNATSVNTLVVYRSAIMQYLTFISDRTSAIGISMLSNITTEDLESVINKHARRLKFFTKNEYLKLLDNRDKVSTHDLAILVLLWHGIRGKEYIDLRSIELSAYDVDTKTITYNGLVHELEDIENDIIYQALHNMSYINHNKKDDTKVIINEAGERVETLKRGAKSIDEYDLDPNNKHIIKPFIETEDGKEGLYRTKLRILGISKAIDNPFLNGVGLYTSGVMYTMLEENDFEEMTYGEMCKWLNERELVLSKAKLTEMQGVMLEKLELENGKTLETEE